MKGTKMVSLEAVMARAKAEAYNQLLTDAQKYKGSELIPAQFWKALAEDNYLGAAEVVSDMKAGSKIS